MRKNLRRLLVTLVLLPAMLAIGALPSFPGECRTSALNSTRSSSPTPTQAGEPDGGQTPQTPKEPQVGPAGSGVEQLVRWMRWTNRAWMASSLRTGTSIRW
jgi:hypothetical protein